MLPIRVRMTLWYGCLLAATLIALGAFLVVQLRAELAAEVDERALNGSAAILRAVGDEAEAQPGDESESGADDDEASERESGTDGRPEAAEDLKEAASTALHSVQAPEAQLLDEDGSVLAFYGARSGTLPLVDAAARQEALSGRPSTLSTRLGDDRQQYRVRVTGFYEEGRPLVLVVAVSLRQAEHDVKQLVTLLLTAGPAAILLTSMAAYWLARRALRPLGTLTSNAQSIGTDNLHERVAVPASNDEVRRLAITLNAMLDRIQHGAKQQRRLIADASHELRTPLAVMRTELDVGLRSNELPSAAREVLVSTREEVDRMTTTVANLLTLAAADEGKLQLLTTTTDLRQTVEQAATPLRTLAAAKGVALEIAGDHWEAQADPQSMRLAVTNLIDNAIKFSPSAGVVRVTTWSSAGKVGITVTDQGPGISAEDREHLFDRFYRVDSARSRTEGGSGLGLAICREVALAHGGQVTVESQPGQGSAFSIELPAWRALHPEQGSGAASVATLSSA